MVSRYRRESASPLHLRGRNCTCTPIKLSKIFIDLCLPSLICRSFRENGSHGEGVVIRVADAADRWCPFGSQPCYGCASPKLDSPVFSTTSHVILPLTIFQIKIRT